MNSAIILISGAGDASVADSAQQILESYSLKILDKQHIAMAGRVIIAFHINFDPAHAKAIDEELSSEMTKHNMDVALEILSE